LTYVPQSLVNCKRSSSCDKEKKYLVTSLSRDRLKRKNLTGSAFYSRQRFFVRTVCRNELPQLSSCFATHTLLPDGRSKSCVIPTFIVFACSIRCLVRYRRWARLVRLTLFRTVPLRNLTPQLSSCTAQTRPSSKSRADKVSGTLVIQLISALTACLS